MTPLGEGTGDLELGINDKDRALAALVVTEMYATLDEDLAAPAVLDESAHIGRINQVLTAGSVGELVEGVLGKPAGQATAHDAAMAQQVVQRLAERSRIDLDRMRSWHDSIRTVDPGAALGVAICGFASRVESPRGGGVFHGRLLAGVVPPVGVSDRQFYVPRDDLLVSLYAGNEADGLYGMAIRTSRLVDGGPATPVNSDDVQVAVRRRSVTVHVQVDNPGHRWSIPTADYQDGGPLTWISEVRSGRRTGHLLYPEFVHARLHDVRRHWVGVPPEAITLHEPAARAGARREDGGAVTLDPDALGQWRPRPGDAKVRRNRRGLTVDLRGVPALALERRRTYLPPGGDRLHADSVRR